MNKRIYTTQAPEPIGPYSQAYIAGNTLYTSGQIAINPATGEFVNGTVEEQAELVMKNISNVLAAAGFSFDDVVKTTCFLAHMSDFSIFNKCYEKYFVSHPARSCVAVKELPKNALVEIDVIAVK